MKRSRTSKTPISDGTSPAGKAETALPAHHLASFPNPSAQRDYLVRIVVPEFTCLCPLTGQPDFARFELDFIPDRRNIELKSLKLYFAAYRNRGAFHEAVTNQVLDDLLAAIAPRFLRVCARWNVRGGIYTTVTVEHRKRGWKPLAVVELGNGSSADLGALSAAASAVPFAAPRS